MNESNQIQRFPYGIIAGMTALSLSLYYWLPDRIPTHFDRWGQPDGFMPRMIGAFFFPILALFLTLVLQRIDKLSPKGYEIARFQNAYDACICWLASFLALVHTLILGFSLGLNVPLHRLVPAACGLLVAAIGLYLPRFKRNFWAGIRTPWSLVSDEAWERTHGAAGPLWVAGGLVIAVSGLLVPELPWLWLGLWIALIGATGWLSYTVSRR